MIEHPNCRFEIAATINLQQLRPGRRVFAEGWCADTDDAGAGPPSLDRLVVRLAVAACGERSFRASGFVRVSGAQFGLGP
jgi:hypothetical protein